MKRIGASVGPRSFCLPLLLLLIVFVPSLPVCRAQAPLVEQGTWTASVGSAGQFFHGTWSAQVSPQSANSLQGSWTLLSDAGDLELEGNWTARKSPRAWQGSWSARAANGGSYSGSWEAELSLPPGK